MGQAQAIVGPSRNSTPRRYPMKSGKNFLSADENGRWGWWNRVRYATTRDK